MRPGQKVSLKIHSSSKTIVDIHILQKNTFLDQVLATNVTLYVGYNKVKFRIPLSGNFVKPSPLNYFAIVENEFSVDHSATFRIGHPGFGLTIRKPVAGDVIKLGNILKVRWKGSYVPPCANSSTFRVERCLIKQTIVRDAEEDVGEIWFIEGQNLNFTTGGLDFETSFMVPNLYKFACIIINKVNGNEFQYSSVVCLHVISSLAIPISNQIKDPWILTNTAGKRLKPANVELCVGHNEVKVAIPSSGNFVKPSPQNYLASLLNGERVDYSATFQIGKPGFDPSTFRIIRLFEPAKRAIGNGQSSIQNFPNDVVTLNFESGGLHYQLPLETIPKTQSLEHSGLIIEKL
ncbi:3220_t:CDS:2 [Diversispora eburnea]|uniref:3220_t:CDS:1 n=1 Tax=Diversispora eburnea TaxID=1213867 RepID=A0A9N9FLR4_9GLOM|nr:3220_t:CDS:2 [Diversispora eburnea]